MVTKKKSRKKKAPPTEPVVPEKERSGRLPGMEDAGIPELEKIAERLSDVRTSRIFLSKKEGELAEDLIAVMKRNEKVEYHHEEVHVWLRVTEEKIKVKIGELDPKAIKKARPPDTPSVVPPETVDAAGEVADEEEDADEFGEYVEEEAEEVGT